MRIVQIIDSLEAGGAERMAVNYANALSREIEFSGLVATRAEGLLKTNLDPAVRYLFLAKKSAFDLRAVVRLHKFCKVNKVEVLHAHSSSWLIAILTKIMYPKIKIIWHDHNGMSEFLDNRPVFLLRIASRLFTGILAVNQHLKNWALEKLACKNVMYAPNFTMSDNETDSDTISKGEFGKRILCLANLRPQKNHQLLLQVALKISQAYPEWTFHLVGKDFDDEYSRAIKGQIIADSLQDTVFLYGSISNTQAVIGQANIGILTSISEGLPVVLLEYGTSGLPVVVTNVGEISAVVHNNVSGLLVGSKAEYAFAEAIERLIADPNLQQTLGSELQRTVAAKFSAKAVMQQYIHWIENIIHVG